MSGVTASDGHCGRCGEVAAFVDSDAKRGYFFSVCLDCGDAYREERTELFWEDLRVGRVDDPRAWRYWEVEADTPPGLVVVLRRDRSSATLGLEWDDPHGDRARREVHEQNARLSPDDPRFVVEAYLSLFNPVSRRWERTYLETGERRPRYLNSMAEYRGEASSRGKWLWD